MFISISAGPKANGTAGSQLSTPRSGKSPSPSPTSPASLRRRQVMQTDVLNDLFYMPYHTREAFLGVLTILASMNNNNNIIEYYSDMELNRNLNDY